MWAPRTDPIDQSLALAGIRALRTGLRRVVEDPMELAGREQTLYGAYLAAVAFASAGSGLHHRICHVLGGMFGLPHAQTHAVVLPHVLALNAPHAEGAERRIAAAFGSPTAEDGLRLFRERLDAPVALRDYGMPAAGGCGSAGRLSLEVLDQRALHPEDRVGAEQLVAADEDVGHQRPQPWRRHHEVQVCGAHGRAADCREHPAHRAVVGNRVRGRR